MIELYIETVIEACRVEISRKSGIVSKDVGLDMTLADLGLTSRDAVEVAESLQAELGIPISPTIVFDHPTIRKIATALTKGDQNRPDPMSSKAGNRLAEPIAIVGIGCRFPGSGVGPNAFFNMLAKGGGGVVEIPSDRWPKEEYFGGTDAGVGETCTKWGGFLDGIDRFDPDFFGISPAEAKRIDPQQRLTLEASFHAMEDAGLSPASLAGSSTAVFMGVSYSDYGELQRDVEDLTASTPSGTALSIVANRVSYVFDLQGPSLAVDSACSSSLLAVHLACEALNSGDASLALAGGVNVMLNPNLGIAFTQAGLLSPDGSCKPFDDRANGYVRGEGVGVVMLQRLSDALADQREIYAVIRGSAVVQDGRSSGLMAPRGPAQESAIRQACARAGVAPAEIAFVEAHGTGTALGDVIEAQALGATVGAGREAGPCLIGSVKSNIGHLESAAGIAGLIKAALSLRNGCWLGNRNYEQPNRRLDLPELGLEVVSDLLPWSDKAARRLASVSSFGFGGTNVHAVLESAEQTVFEREDTSPEPILLAISAPDSLGLERTIALALNQFEHEKDPVRALNWIASSARRTPSKLRLAIVGSNPAEVVRQLREASKRSNERALAAGGLGLVFNGQGSLWQGAGRDLFATSIIYRDSLMEVDASLKAQGLESVLLTLFADDADQRAAKTELAQPAIFASQVALTCLLRSWGAVPAAVAGHSVGEVAAAWAAGCVTLDVAARIVAARSQAMIETRGGGGMVLLSCSNERCIELIVGIPGVTIAAINGPSSSVISGDQTALNEAVARAGRAGVVTRHLNVDYAFHSPQMEIAAKRVRGALFDIDCSAPAIPFFSSVDGALRSDPLDSEYWSRNVLQPVCFASAAQALGAVASNIVEIGTNSVLLRDLRELLPTGAVVLPTLRRDAPGTETLLRTAARLWELGELSDLSAVKPGSPQGAEAPPMVWGGASYWVDAIGSAKQRTSRSFLHSSQDLAAPPGGRIWSGSIGGSKSAYLLDHEIFGFAVLPGAAFIDMGLRVATDLFGDEAVLQDIRFLEPLVLSADEVVEVQIVGSASAEGMQLDIFARRENSDNNWCRHASAFAQRRQQDLDTPPTDIDRLRSRCFDQYPQAIFYALLRDKGLAYGPAFRGVDFVVGRAGEAIGSLGASPVSGGNHLIQPAVLDAGLQVVAASFGARQLSDSNISGGLPIRVDSVCLLKPGLKPAWSHARLLSADGPVSRADVDFLDETGAAILRVKGLELKNVGQTVATELATQQALKNWLYELRWTTLSSSSESRPERPLLLIGEDSTLLAQLRSALETAGVGVEAWTCGNRTTFAPGVSQVARWADLPLNRYSGGSRPRMIFVQPRDIGDPDNSKLSDPSAQMIALIHILSSGEFTVSPEIGFLSWDGSAPIKAGPIRPDQAALSGLLRTALLEHPDLEPRIFDASSGDTLQQVADKLVEALEHSDEAYVALREAACLAPRLTRAGGSAPHTKLDPHGLYLVTGGLGALGTEAAAGLVECGARRIVLVGRRAELDPAVAQRLQSAGSPEPVEIHYLSRDLSDFDEVSRLAHEVRQFGELRGLVHSAGVVDDGSLAAMTAERLNNTFGPKAVAAVALDQAFTDCELDFFIIFSSAAGLLGSPGQSNYSAANAAADAVALARCARGKAGLSINWGAWSGRGIAAEAIPADSLSQSRLIEMIDPDQGRELFKRLLGRQGSLMMFPGKLEALVQFYPSHAGLSLLADLTAGTLAQVRGGRTSEQLYERPDMVVEYVAPRTEIEAAIVGIWQRAIGMSGIGVRDELFALGGDSVFASQILALVNKKYKIQIDPEEAYELFTIEKLATAVERKLFALVENMDDETVAALLAQGGAE